MDRIPDYVKAVIFDVDGSVMRGETIGAYVGRKLMLKQIPFHPGKLIKGYSGMREVKKIVREHGEDSAARGLQKFFEIVEKTTTVTRKELNEITKDAIKHCEIPGFSYFNSRLQNVGIKTFFSTIEYDEVGKVGVSDYGLSGYVANPVEWLNSKNEIVRGNEIVCNDFNDNVRIGEDFILKGCHATIRNSKHKENANSKLMAASGIDENRVCVIGNDYIDHDSMLRFFPMASPPADGETVKLVKERDGIHITDYSKNTVDKLLRKF